MPTSPSAVGGAPGPQDIRPGCVLVGHPHPRLSEGLRDWLAASFEGLFVVADRASLVAGAHKLQPVLVIVDLLLAEGRLEAMLAELQRQAPGCPTLLLSDYDDARADAAALAAGASGVVHKSSLATDLSDAVDAVLAGRRFTSPPSAH
jgi:DNA-binding NarL/FixJ family response regulator